MDNQTLTDLLNVVKKISEDRITIATIKASQRVAASLLVSILPPMIVALAH